MPQLLASLSPKLRDLFPVRGAHYTEVSCGLLDTRDNERRVYFGSPYDLFSGRVADQFEWYIAEVSPAATILRYLDRLGACATNKVPKDFRDRIRKVYCEYLEERFP